MSRHTRPDDDDDGNDEGDDVTAYTPTVADTVTRWRYTLSPVTYVSEDSSTEEIMWQLLLEQRATRHWLALIWWTVLWAAIATAVVIVSVN